VTAPPPDEPDGPRDPRDRDDLDFDAEFERMVAGWQPSEPDPSDETDDSPSDGDADGAAAARPEPADGESLRKLFRGAWPDEDPADRGAEFGDADEHFVPPPAPPIPRPEPRRLLAWAGLLGAPLVGLLFLLLGGLPAAVSFLLFCWFVGGFGYLVATMNDGNRDGWDNGAQV
jgi:hypothetical protein